MLSQRARIALAASSFCWKANVFIDILTGPSTPLRSMVLEATIYPSFDFLSSVNPVPATVSISAFST